MTPALTRAAALVLLAGEAPAQEAPDWAEAGALFAERCVMCHSGPDAPLGLHLDSFEGALAGSEDGPVLVPGDLGGSELLRRVRGESQPQMPLVGEPLGAEEIAMLEAWVEAGLPEGEVAAAEGVPPEDGEDVAASAAPEAPTGLDEGLAPEPDAADGLPAPGEPVTFADVQPIFLRRCALCHSDANPDGPQEGLRLDTLSHILAGGERLVLVPGNPEASEIVRRVEGTAQPRMPFNGPPFLTEQQIRVIRDWIAQGAPDAEGVPAPVPVGREVRYRGTLTGPEEIDGIPFRITGGTRVDDRPSVGQEAEVRGVVEADGGIAATRFRDR
ncbi:MAG TPA: c-type cytochrome domain-containing protein [Rubellimicrobium sp.]|nr:c-type cytochrome domain-containing protein [Rubellimicrobium sp.]